MPGRKKVKILKTLFQNVLGPLKAGACPALAYFFV